MVAVDELKERPTTRVFRSISIRRTPGRRPFGDAQRHVHVPGILVQVRLVLLQERERLLSLVPVLDDASVVKISCKFKIKQLITIVSKWFTVDCYL